MVTVTVSEVLPGARLKYTRVDVLVIRTMFSWVSVLNCISFMRGCLKPKARVSKRLKQNY